MILTSFFSPILSRVKETLYQVALTTGRVIWALPFLMAAIAGFLIVSPLWLGEKIALTFLAHSNAAGERFSANEE